MAIDLSDYNTVPERLAEAKLRYPQGRFQSRIVELPEAFAGLFVAVEAKFYRAHDDQIPAVGLAWEPVPGKTPYTRDSELMNAETSAWGRALIAAFAADAKKGVASREEVQARQPEPRPRQGGMKRIPGPRTEVGVTVTKPQERPQEAHQTNGNDGTRETLHQIQRDLLTALDGDKPKAQMIWRQTLEMFGLASTDEVPADLVGPIRTATLDQFAQTRLLEDHS